MQFGLLSIVIIIRIVHLESALKLIGTHAAEHAAFKPLNGKPLSMKNPRQLEKLWKYLSKH